MLHNFTLHNFKVFCVMFNIDFLCSFLLYVESLPFSLSPPPLHPPTTNSLHYFLYASHLHLLDVCCYYIFVHIFRIASILSEISLTVVLSKHFMRKCICMCKCIMWLYRSPLHLFSIIRFFDLLLTEFSCKFRVGVHTHMHTYIQFKDKRYKIMSEIKTVNMQRKT